MAKLVMSLHEWTIEFGPFNLLERCLFVNIRAHPTAPYKAGYLKSIAITGWSTRLQSHFHVPDFWVWIYFNPVRASLTLRQQYIKLESCSVFDTNQLRLSGGHTATITCSNCYPVGRACVKIRQCCSRLLYISCKTANVLTLALKLYKQGVIASSVM